MYIFIKSLNKLNLNIILHKGKKENSFYMLTL